MATLTRNTAFCLSQRKNVNEKEWTLKVKGTLLLVPPPGKLVKREIFIVIDCILPCPVKNLQAAGVKFNSTLSKFSVSLNICL